MVKVTTGFILVKLTNGERLEFLNEQGLSIRNEIYNKWDRGETVNIEGISYNSDEIHDIDYSFVTENTANKPN